jgi:predicted amidohydrolase YtcJ
MNKHMPADMILLNGRVTTLDVKHPEASALAIKDGRIAAVDNAESFQRGPNTRVIELKGHRVIPGLNDSHLHVIRGASITTWSCAGTVCPPSQMVCVC